MKNKSEKKFLPLRRLETESVKDSENACHDLARYAILCGWWQRTVDHLCRSFEGPGQELVQGMVQLVNTRVIPWSGTIHSGWITSPANETHRGNAMPFLWLSFLRSNEYVRIPIYTGKSKRKCELNVLLISFLANTFVRNVSVPILNAAIKEGLSSNTWNLSRMTI